MAVSSSGDITVSGFSADRCAMRIGATVLAPGAFAASFTSSGALRWARNIGVGIGPNDRVLLHRSLTVDAAGNAYLLGGIANLSLGFDLPPSVDGQAVLVQGLYSSAARFGPFTAPPTTQAALGFIARVRSTP